MQSGSPTQLVMLNLKLLSVVTALGLGAIAVFNLKAPAVPKPVEDNVIGLFLVKKDQINQQYRGELYPIAQYKNGKYLDASVNVTLEVREDSSESAIVKRNLAKSILNQPKTFAVLDTQGKTITQFAAKKAGVGQFACESFLVGRGEVLDNTKLPSLFDQLPKARSQGMSGFINGKQVDEVWKWTISSQRPVAPARLVSVSPAQLKQYRADLERIGTAEINQTKEAKAFSGTAILDDFQVVDLDGDGKHEVYAKLHKGVARGTPIQGNVDRSTVRSVYANVWLSYQNDQPKLISKQVFPQFVPASNAGREYDVLQLIDTDSDGQSEVLVRNNGYEGVSFSIYKLQNNQLKPVFTGAGYGC